MNDDNVVSLKTPSGDKDKVDAARWLFSEVQNARVTDFAVVYMGADGQFGTIRQFETNTDEVAGAVLLTDEINRSFLQ